jgi:competence protein ComEA
MPVLTRPQLAAYAVAAVVVVVLAVRFMQGQARHEAANGAAAATSAHASGGPVGAEASAGAQAPAGVAIERPPAETPLVHVAGAVRRPGVYRLRGGERVQDAVRRAGGARHGADLNAINLAAKVADGQQVVVPRRGAAAGASTAVAAASPSGDAAAGGGGPPQAPVSLNSATAEQLDTLDGVGPATAQKILDWRTQHGGFQSVDDLSEVPGIGPKRLAALRPKVQL